MLINNLTFIFYDSYLDLIAAYKQGFRWRTVGYKVPATPIDAVPSNRLPSSTPTFVSVPSEPHTPTGAGLDSVWTTPSTSSTVPWSTATAPPLPTTTPKPYWSYDRKLDLRKRVTKPTITRDDSTTTRPSAPTAPTAPASVALPTPDAPLIVVVPIEPVGTPGSSHDNVDKVFDDYNTFIP